MGVFDSLHDASITYWKCKVFLSFLRPLRPPGEPAATCRRGCRRRPPPGRHGRIEAVRGRGLRYVSAPVGLPDIRARGFSPLG
jgi:hypothetical protein